MLRLQWIGIFVQRHSLKTARFLHCTFFQIPSPVSLGLNDAGAHWISCRQQALHDVGVRVLADAGRQANTPPSCFSFRGGPC